VEWMHVEWMHMDVIDVARILAAPPQSLHGGATSACIRALVIVIFYMTTPASANRYFLSAFPTYSLK
jgi:hypothetical protein